MHTTLMLQQSSTVGAEADEMSASNASIVVFITEMLLFVF